jgi:Holliday junction resolvase-like predicted endonuclease
MSAWNRKIWDEWELVAIWYLQSIGVDIIDTNFFIKWWEIDIIGRKWWQVIFYEVKYRKSFSHWLPEESLNKSKRSKLLFTVNSYCLSKKINLDSIRIDFLAISRWTDQKNEIKHFENISLY